MKKVRTGVTGLDQILGGGLPGGELYAVQGSPGTGKTALGLHFLRAGLEEGERCLLLTLSQREASVRDTIASFGWEMDGLTIHELTAANAMVRLAESQAVFRTAEVELDEMMRELLNVVDELDPVRVVLDAISHLRMFANTALGYRRQLLVLRDYFADRDITTLVTDNRFIEPGDGELDALAHGVIILAQGPTEYGNQQRHIHVTKVRGLHFHEGIHDMTIDDSGLQVYPRTQPIPGAERPPMRVIKSGLDELDDLLGGGLHSGSSCLFIGPSGTGKTSTVTQFAHAAALRGARSSIFLFDELIQTFCARSEGIGMPVRRHMEQGLLRLHEIGIGETAPGRFAGMVLDEVEKLDLEIVIIDTLTGYANAMVDTRLLVTQMHELLSVLSQRGVLSFLVVAQHGVVGSELAVPIDVSYLADSVLLLRHFEARGEIRQAISVFKKRMGPHERQIRELRITSSGLRIEKPISDFTGILSGTPHFIGDNSLLLAAREEEGR